MRLALVAVDSKACAWCGTVKPLDEFFRRGRSPDGRASRCRQCDLASATSRRLANRTRGVAVAEKRCARCEAVRPATSFAKSGNTVSGLTSYCNACRTFSERSYARRRRYGLSDDAFRAMLDSQGARCAICRGAIQEGRDLHVDHCHRTGRVRGLLCGACNPGLGNFRENVATLSAAIAYLERVQ